MANLTMDLTGLNANYTMRDRVYRVFKYGQLVDLERVVFKDTLKVFLVSSGLPTYQLEEGVDYIIPEQFVSSCDNDMSAAKMMDPYFNRELVSGIQMIRGMSEDAYFTIQVQAQQLYPNQLRTAYFHNAPLELTPDLTHEIVSNLEQLNILASRVTDTSSIVEGGCIYLELDDTKTNDCNYIQDEEHRVEVVAGRFMIHPKGGSFYYDSITVKHPSTGQTLQEGVDYFIVGMNVAKTKATSHTAPVYDFIMIVSPIVDTLLVSYHAFGGEPTLDNFKDLLQSVENIQMYLKDAKALTIDTLGRTEIMTSLYERIERLERKMRRLDGTPAYGDVTSGKTILMKLFSEQYPSRLNWWTIASLYTTLGGSKPHTADTFMFRFQSSESHIQFTAAVSVDLHNTKGNRFNVNLISENYPRGFIPFEDYENILKIIRPQLRVIWLDSEVASGAYLQLGFQLRGMAEELVSIEDISGHESCWKLVDEIKQVSLPENDTVKLPNGEVWNSLLEEAQVESYLLPYKKGHLIWAGARELNRPEDGWNFIVFNEDLHLDNYTDISRVSKLRLDLQEDQGMAYSVDIPFNTGTEKVSGRVTDIYSDKPAYFNAEISKNEDGQIELVLNYDITAGSDSNPLILRDMVIYTD